jgi:hypothetical protein
MQPLYDALRDMLPNEKIEDYILKELSNPLLLCVEEPWIMHL